MTTLIKNSFVTEQGLYHALADLAALIGLDARKPTSQERAAQLANQILAALQPVGGIVTDAADTSVTVADNATGSYTSTVDGWVVFNDFTGSGGQVVQLNGTTIATVAANERITVRVAIGDVVDVVDTADGGTTYKRAVISRW